MPDLVDCPYCGFAFPDNAEYVDVGWGGGRDQGIQVTGNRCDRCNATESGAYEVNLPMEHETGWFAPGSWNPEDAWIAEMARRCFDLGVQYMQRRIDRPAAHSPADSLAPAMRQAPAPIEPKELVDAPF